MGACFAPNYANLFLGLWEERYIYSTHNSFLDNIVMWGRYIDDVLIIWSGSESELHRFHQYINGINRNLKLSLEYSVSENNFLDLKITKEANGVLHTSIFRKPTDRNTILRANSFHPPWLIENIPHGQFQRLKRICDREDDYEIQLQDMTSRFQPSFNDYNRVFFSTTYSREATQIRRIIYSNWNIIESDSTLRAIFREQPMVSYRRSPTIRNKVVRSYLPAPEKITWLGSLAGNFRCGRCITL